MILKELLNFENSTFLVVLGVLICLYGLLNIARYFRLGLLWTSILVCVSTVLIPIPSVHAISACFLVGTYAVALKIKKLVVKCQKRTKQKDGFETVDDVTF